jgi:hypothetical protein
MLYPFALALALLLGVGITGSRAETPEEQNACFSDASRLCPEAIPDRERVFACLVRNKTKLSRLCRSAIERDVTGARKK